MKNKTILFLFAELSGYMLSCFKNASDNGFEIHVVSYQTNLEAPFEIDKSINKSLFFYNKNEFNCNNKLNGLVLKINPRLIFVSGWMDKVYFKFAIKKNNNYKKILLLDNTWLGSLKQNLWSFYFKHKYKDSFKAVWIPGNGHNRYANKLGFKDYEIFDGLYTCDTKLFNSFYFNSYIQKKDNFPKRFLFVGRYDDVKGLKELWVSFINAMEKNDFKWELWCVGTGKLWDSRLKHPLIRHFGFVQPEKLKVIIQESGIYVLPSRYEPWGVSLHEMVTSGMPVLISENIGSKIYFQKEKINGMSFSHSIKNDLEDKMISMMRLSNEKLFEMGQESVNLSNNFSSETWLDTLNKLYD